MKIITDRLGPHNLVFNCILLISISQYSLAGPELLFNGNNFFYRLNGKEVPVELSLGTEIARFQEELNHPSQRKIRETVQYASEGLTKNVNNAGLGPLYAYVDRRNEGAIDLGSKIVENKIGGMVAEEHPPARYAVMASINGKDLPVGLSLATERFQEELDYPSQRKTRETAQSMNKGLTKNENGEGLGSLNTYEDRRNKGAIDSGSKIVENKLGGMVEEENPPTRYEAMARIHGKDVPVGLSPGTERFQDIHNYPSQQKTRETLQYMDKGQLNEGLGSWPTIDDRRNKSATDLGTEIVQNKLGGMMTEEEHRPTRYDIMASMAFNLAVKNPEDLINDIISMISEDIEKHIKEPSSNPNFHLQDLLD